MKLTAFEITRYLFLLTVAILVLLGIGSLLRVGDNPDRTALYVFYGAAMFGDAVFMAFCAWQLPKRTKFIFVFSVFILAINILLTIFDQFGLVDLLFVSLNFVTLVFLILARKEFVPA